MADVGGCFDLGEADDTFATDEAVGERKEEEDGTGSVEECALEVIECVSRSMLCSSSRCDECQFHSSCRWFELDAVDMS